MGMTLLFLDDTAKTNTGWLPRGKHPLSGRKNWVWQHPRRNLFLVKQLFEDMNHLNSYIFWVIRILDRWKYFVMRRSSEIPTKVLRLWDGRRCSLCAWLPYHRPPHLLGPWQVGNGIIVVIGIHCTYMAFPESWGSVLRWKPWPQLPTTSEGSGKTS